MGILSIYHPDIFEYLDSKSFDAGKLKNFNLSIMIDDAFMSAVAEDKKIMLHYPVYDEKGKMIKDESEWIVKKEQSAKELWDVFVRKVYNTGEYGVFFYDNLNKNNNTWYCETIVGSNPCGEYVSGLVYYPNINSLEYKGACNLGSIFLQNLIKNPFTKYAEIDYITLGDATRVAVRFLDNIIDKNKFPHKSYERYQKALRTIGLGITGLCDMFTMLNMKYGSPESVELTKYLMNFIAKEAYKASIELAKEKSSFQFLDKEKFVQSGYIQKHLQYDSDWQIIIDDIRKYGIRNARLISIAPTGTLSLTYGENCSSGLEPIVMLKANRKVKIGGQAESDIQIVEFYDYAYSEWLKTTENNIVKEDIFTSSVIEGLSVQDHLDILQAVTFNVDMSCSKTINLPSTYTFEQTKDVYEWCWKNDIKGCTLFRPNELREGIFVEDKVEHKEDKIEDKKEEPKFDSKLVAVQVGMDVDIHALARGEWAKKPADTTYEPVKIYTGCGKFRLFIGHSPSEKRVVDFYVLVGNNGGCVNNIQTTVIAMSGMLRLGGSLHNIEKAFKGLGLCNSFRDARKAGRKVSKGNCCGSAILEATLEFATQKGYDNYGVIKKEAMQSGFVNRYESLVQLDGCAGGCDGCANSTCVNRKPADIWTMIIPDEKIPAFKQRVDETLKIVFKGQVEDEKICPECGEPMTPTGSCKTCPSCGFSNCG